MKAARRIILGIGVVAALAAAAYSVWSRLGPAAAPPEEASPETATRPAETRPASAATSDAEAVQSKVLVTEQAVRASRKRSRYICDPKIPGGTLKGMCYVKYDKRVRLYPPFPVELEGANAIPEPQKGERDYYESRKPMPWVHLDDYAAAEKRYGVKGAVVMIRDVQAGSRADFDRLRFQVDFRNHQIIPARPEGRGVFNPSAYDIGVMRVKQLVQALNLSLYDGHLVLADVAGGKPVWEQPLEKYHDPNFPGMHLGSNPVMKRPTVYQIPRIERKGIYRLSCRRHPWQQAYLVLWDSPYVTVSRGDEGRGRPQPEIAGEFVITGVPPGEHTVEVWHGEYEPVHKTHKVEISMDETTGLSVEFKVPAVLKAKPKPLPDKPITEWACVGPFDPLMDEEPDAPNNRFDFAATYDGMDEPVSWKRVKTDADPRAAGYVLLHKALRRVNDLSLSYFAVQIDSPKPQKLYLMVHNQADGLKMWLNGKTIFRSYTGDFGHYARYRSWFIVTGDLQAGKNTLLLLVSAEMTERARFAVKYRAEGATVKVPVK